VDGKIKAPTAVGRMGLVGLGISGIATIRPAGAYRRNFNEFSLPSAVARV
jgi:hypothetical protein